MKKYVSPELEVLKLNIMDVITTSLGGTTGSGSAGSGSAGSGSGTPGNGDDDMGWH